MNNCHLQPARITRTLFRSISEPGPSMRLSGARPSPSTSITISQWRGWLQCTTEARVHGVFLSSSRCCWAQALWNASTIQFWYPDWIWLHAFWRPCSSNAPCGDRIVLFSQCYPHLVQCTVRYKIWIWEKWTRKWRRNVLKRAHCLLDFSMNYRAE